MVQHFVESEINCSSHAHTMTCGVQVIFLRITHSVSQSTPSGLCGVEPLLFEAISLSVHTQGIDLPCMRAGVRHGFV